MYPPPYYHELHAATSQLAARALVYGSEPDDNVHAALNLRVLEDSRGRMRSEGERPRARGPASAHARC